MNCQHAKNMLTMRRNLILIVLIALAATGCSKYGYVSLTYPVEPEAYLPRDVHSIAIVNRSLTSEEEKDAKVFEAMRRGDPP